MNQVKDLQDCEEGKEEARAGGLLSPQLLENDAAGYFRVGHLSDNKHLVLLAQHVLVISLRQRLAPPVPVCLSVKSCPRENTGHLSNRLHTSMRPRRQRIAELRQLRSWKYDEACLSDHIHNPPAIQRFLENLCEGKNVTK